MTHDFLLLSPGDRASWRSGNSLFISYLNWEEARCADAVLALVRLGRKDEAALADAKLCAIQELKSVIFMEGAKATTEAEEEFHDPAELVTK